MTRKPTKPLTPKLRFPGFRDAPEWYKSILGNLGEVVTGSTPATKRHEYYGGKYCFVSPADIDDNRFVHTTQTTLTDLGFAKARSIPASSTLFVCIGSTIGKIAQNAEECATNQQINAIVPNREIVGDFLFYLLSMASRRIAEMAGKHAVPIVNKTLFSGVELLVPMPAEQAKIAACLSSLDGLIAAAGRKLTGLRDHKRGLMQQLFPQPGETQPRLRFPEFEGEPAWVPHKFGDLVVKSFYGTSKSTSEMGEYPVLRMGNMVDGGLDLSNLVHIDLERQKFETIQLQKGDILLNRTNSLDLVGKISLFELDSEYLTASYIVSFRLDTARVDPKFCNLMLNTYQYQAKIKLLATPSVSQANINPTTFRSGLSVLAPATPEQIRIAGFISALDAQITGQAEQIESLKTHKRGLMQQLFPSPEEGPT